MKKIASLLLAGAVVALSANAARAADIIETPVYSEPAPPAVIEEAGGWYIRGDIDYHMADMGGVTYAAGGGTNVFDSAELDRVGGVVNTVWLVKQLHLSSQNINRLDAFQKNIAINVEHRCAGAVC